MILLRIFMGLLYFSPQLISVYININNEITCIPIFNIYVFNTLKFIIIVSLILLILKGTLKLIWGRWTINRAIILSTLEVLSAGFAVYFFSNLSIWNEAIISGFEKYLPISFSTVSNWMVAIIIIAAIVDVLISMYKGYNYGR